MCAAEQTEIRVGPAGWSYDDWKGIVYPADVPRKRHPLTFLSEYFDTVEVNTSFYRPPRSDYAASWLENVSANPRFKFTFKLWERFTHQRESWPDDSEAATFKAGIAPIVESGRFGALLVQFPWSFKRTDENRQWLARVIDTFAEYPLALEVRHASWDRPEVYRGLAERGVAFCNIDQPLFQESLPPTERATARVGYVRLHGRNRDDWFREDAGRDDRYDYLYSEEELQPWVERIRSISKRVREVYAVTNNHFRGQAVVNAFELLAGLGKPVFSIAKPLLGEYPRLKALFKRQDSHNVGGES